MSARDGDIQLGIWCAAAFNRRDDLVFERAGDSIPLPVVPLWLIEGQFWNLSIALQESRDEIRIYGPIHTFSTRSLGDTVRLISTITAIMDWGVHIYLPWFLASIRYPE